MVEIMGLVLLVMVAFVAWHVPWAKMGAKITEKVNSWLDKV